MLASGATLARLTFPVVKKLGSPIASREGGIVPEKSLNDKINCPLDKLLRVLNDPGMEPVYELYSRFTFLSVGMLERKSIEPESWLYDAIKVSKLVKLVKAVGSAPDRLLL